MSASSVGNVVNSKYRFIVTSLLQVLFFFTSISFIVPSSLVNTGTISTPFIVEPPANVIVGVHTFKLTNALDVLFHI